MKSGGRAGRSRDRQGGDGTRRSRRRRPQEAPRHEATRRLSEPGLQLSNGRGEHRSIFGAQHRRQHRHRPARARSKSSEQSQCEPRCSQRQAAAPAPGAALHHLEQERRHVLRPHLASRRPPRRKATAPSGATAARAGGSVIALARRSPARRDPARRDQGSGPVADRKARHRDAKATADRPSQPPRDSRLKDTSRLPAHSDQKTIARRLSESNAPSRLSPHVRVRCHAGGGACGRS